jgi:deoxycytidylate deaminase
MPSATPKKAPSSLESKKKDKNIIEIIKDRQTEELVFAFCGPLGSGISTVAKVTEDIISKYKYETKYYKISSIIEKYLPLVKSEIEKTEYLKDINLSLPLNEIDPADRINILQSAGNQLREQFGNNILAQLIIKEIAINRQDRDDGETEIEIKKESRRFVSIIDSLKHPDEYRLLQAVYGNMFYLFGVLCPDQIRKERLNQEKKMSSGKEALLMERDKEEDIFYGQKLLKSLQYADFFIRNVDINVNIIKQPIKRYIKLILGNIDITPTIDEYAMYCAQSAALRSSCLSRQVGAAIVSSNNELITTGTNDVPKYKGGQYTSDDKGNDGRCFNLYGNMCKNSEYKKDIFNDIKNILLKNLDDPTNANKIAKQISNQERLKSLMEFSRSVHAEMDAITTAARIGSTSLKNSTLYCTTFPCHNCARHIVASGITKVYYIEPFEKSLARELHNDAIDFEPKNDDLNNKVIFMPFGGVAPKQYLNLFQRGDRKIDGKEMPIDLTRSKPTVVKLLDTFLEYESKIVEFVKRLELD